MNFSDSEQAAFCRLLQWRRDVRHFLPDLVPESHLEKLRQAMDFAPSVGNSRPWRVLRVESTALREAIHAEFVQSNLKAASVYSAERQTQYAELKLEGLQIAPVQLAIFTETVPCEGHGLGRQSMPSTLEQSTCMAIQNLNLMARSLGLGVGMLSILNPRNMERLFSVPPNWQFTLYLCIGRPQFTDDTPLLHRNEWQINTESAWKSV